MAERKPRHIDSLDELHRRLPEMVRQQETHPRLAIAALANPLLALERLGYTIEPAIAREAAARTRFSRTDADRLLSLDRELRQALGDDIDLDDMVALAPRVLRVVHPPRPKQARTTAKAKVPDTVLRDAIEKPPAPVPFGTPRIADPLAGFRDAHPVIEQLLAYRTLEASRPRLASRALFDALLSGKAAAPVTAARLRYKRAPERSAKGR